MAICDQEKSDLPSRPMQCHESLRRRLLNLHCFVPIPALKTNLAAHDYHLAELAGGFLNRPTPSSTKPIDSTTAPT